MGRAAKGEGSIYKTDKGWRGAITVNGKKKYFSAPTKAEASAKRRALILQRDTGELSTGKSMTVAEWVKRWHVLTESSHTPATHASYRTIIEKQITPGIGKKRRDKPPQSCRRLTPL